MSGQEPGNRNASVAGSGAIELETPAAPAFAPANNERLRFGLACAAAALTFVVIVASAFMRHTQAGLGCADWPACYGRVAASAADTAAATPIGIHIARLLHRLAASAALVLVVGILLLGRGARSDSRQRVLAFLALLVALALAALGLATPGARLPAIPLGNLGGGLSMLALLAALAGSFAPVSRAASHGGDLSSPWLFHADPPRQRVLVLALFAVVFFHAIAGGLIGTQFALPACPELDLCTAGARGAVISPAWKPFNEPVMDAGRVVAPAGSDQLHALHRLLGIAVACAALALAFAMRFGNPRGAALLAVLAVVAPLLGALAIVRMPALGITVLHNAVAAAMIATLVYLAARR
jgi:cytochrome c oxidase assembly protein subunit 15